MFVQPSNSKLCMRESTNLTNLFTPQMGKLVKSSADIVLVIDYRLGLI